jgi:hypothetical protein
MQRFKVGDIVVPLPSADERYVITNSSMESAVVIAANKYWDEIRIRILAHKNKNHVGRTFEVHAFDFKHKNYKKIHPINIFT